MSQHPAIRAYTTITSLDWAMTEEYLDLMVAIALRDNDPVQVIEARLGRRLDNTRTVTVRDGVATIPIIGPIFRYADFFTMVSGGVTVGTLAQDLATALDDPQISAIVLQIDSPGGEINGVNELAAMIAAARAVKPITAYVSYLGASGAYWLASAASRIVVDATALLGSIGVRTAVRDPAKAPSRDIEFVSSQSPGKRNDPTTDAGRAAIQARIDRLADVFTDAVARNRGVSVDHVVAHFGRGGLLVGADAVAAGMADALGSYEGVLAQLAAPVPSLFALPGISAGPSTKEIAMPPDAPETTATTDTTAAELAALRQQLAQERQQRISSEADAFAERQIRASRMSPGERDAWVALYTAIAADDAASPRADTARTALLASAFAARPQHQLTAELVELVPLTPTTAAAPVSVAANTTTTPAPADAQTTLISEAEAAAKAYAARANGSRKV